MPTPTASVLLVAHGSARSGASAEPVLALARALREQGWPEVRTAFWKEEPFLHQALDGVRGDPVVVLPVFLATGYFSQTVVPRELGLSEGVQERGGRCLGLLPPLASASTWKKLAEVAVVRAREAGPDDVPLAESLVVILGHGTLIDSDSATAVMAVATLMGAGTFGRVEWAFIDGEPKLEAVLTGAPEPVAIVVPFLMAEGFHGAAVADGGEAWSPSIRVVYSEPIGTHPAIVDVIRSLLDAAPPLEPAGSDGPVAPAERALAGVLAAHGAVVFLQLAIATAADHGYELRHASDVEQDAAKLTAVPDLDALAGLARRTGAGAHRPLRTAADLPRGWRWRAADPRALGEALIALYGPALAHWEMGRSGSLKIMGFRERAAAQTGMYARLAAAPPAAVEEGVRRVCDGLPCLRCRLWSLEGARPGVGLGPMDVPCPTPCPVLLTAVLEASAGEVDDPGESP